MGGRSSGTFFPGGANEKGVTHENLRRSRFKNFAAPEMSPIIDENVFPFLRALNGQDGSYATQAGRSLPRSQPSFS